MNLIVGHYNKWIHNIRRQQTEQQRQRPVINDVKLELSISIFFVGFRSLWRFHLQDQFSSSPIRVPHTTPTVRRCSTAPQLMESPMVSPISANYYYSSTLSKWELVLLLKTVSLIDCCRFSMRQPRCSVVVRNTTTSRHWYVIDFAGFRYHSVLSLNCVGWQSLREMAPRFLSIFAVRLLPKLGIIFNWRHAARCAPSLAIVHSLSLVHGHGTNFQWTFDLWLSNLLNVNINDIYFVSPLVFN